MMFVVHKKLCSRIVPASTGHAHLHVIVHGNIFATKSHDSDLKICWERDGYFVLAVDIAYIISDLGNYVLQVEVLLSRS